MNQFWVRELPSGTCESGGGIPAPGQRGFTILELMVTLIIAAIISSIAVPSFQSLIQETRRNSSVSSIADAIVTARVEAVTRGVPVTLCATANPENANPTCSGSNTWETGIVVRDGAGAIQVWGPPPDGLSLRAAGFTSTSQVAFSIDGTLAASGTFTLCDPAGDSEALGIVVTIAGLSRIAIDSDGNGVVEGHNGGNVSCP